MRLEHKGSSQSTNVFLYPGCVPIMADCVPKTARVSFLKPLANC